jgi:hypothetical protein
MEAQQRLSVAQMVVANKPWKLVPDLSKVLVATLASAGFFIVNSNTWGIAEALPFWRLLAVALVALAGLGLWLIVAHELWEPPSASNDPEVTRRVNVATALTLFLGLVFGYLVLFLIVLAAMALVVPDSYLGKNIGHQAGFGDYVVSSWLSASLATVAGAIGSGLESDEDVKETVARYRPSPEGVGSSVSSSGGTGWPNR